MMDRGLCRIVCVIDNKRFVGRIPERQESKKHDYYGQRYEGLVPLIVVNIPMKDQACHRDYQIGVT